MQLELNRGVRLENILRRHDELLDAHAEVALAIAAAPGKFEWAVEDLILKALNGEGRPAHTPRASSRLPRSTVYSRRCPTACRSKPLVRTHTARGDRRDGAVSL